ncbi:MAG: mannonate dehydratase [Synergistaceae bacterium]|nr:mannonate dehydratase [Synergistaceae bacterium]
MKMIFEGDRAYDPMTLGLIRGIPSRHGIIGALHDIAPGEIWPERDIAGLRETAAESFGLPLDAVSNLPVHEDIIMGRGECQVYTNNYKENIANLARNNVKCVCYRFALPMRADTIDEELWENLKIFIDEIIPVASKCGVNMALYASNETDEAFIDKFMSMNRERENGLAMYSSLDIRFRNGFRKMVRKYGALGRVHLAYLYTSKILDDIFFNEKEEPFQGVSPNLTQIIKTFYDADFDGYLCPGTGDMLAGEAENFRDTSNATQDIALGATYLSGIWEMLKTCAC